MAETLAAQVREQRALIFKRTAFLPALLKIKCLQSISNSAPKMKAHRKDSQHACNATFKTVSITSKNCLEITDIIRKKKPNKTDKTVSTGYFLFKEGWVGSFSPSSSLYLGLGGGVGKGRRLLVKTVQRFLCIPIHLLLPELLLTTYTPNFPQDDKYL